MQEIIIINTGGTFNKIYNPLTGNLDIDTKGTALLEIEKNWLNKYKIINIIGKDSLDLTDEDRAFIVKTVKSVKEERIILVHGTDTMHITAKFLGEEKIIKTIILTGSMVPYSINPIEAISNLATAYGFLHAIESPGVYISMNGRIGDYKRVVKNKEKGYFEDSK